MALITLVLTDTGPGTVDLAIHADQGGELSPVDLPDDTPAVRIGRRMVTVAKLTAAQIESTKPQEN